MKHSNFLSLPNHNIQKPYTSKNSELLIRTAPETAVKQRSNLSLLLGGETVGACFSSFENRLLRQHPCEQESCTF